MRELQTYIEIRPAKTVATRRLREVVQAHLRAASYLTAIELAGRAYGRAPARKHVRGLPAEITASQRSAMRRVLARMKRRGEIVVARRHRRKAVYMLAGEARLLAKITLDLGEALRLDR